MPINYNIMNIISEKYIDMEVENRIKDRLKNIYCFIYETDEPIFFKVNTESDACIYILKIYDEERKSFIEVLKDIYNDEDERYDPFKEYIIEDINQLNDNTSYEELEKYIPKIDEFLNRFSCGVDFGFFFGYYLDDISSDIIKTLQIKNYSDIKYQSKINYNIVNKKVIEIEIENRLKERLKTVYCYVSNLRPIEGPIFFQAKSKSDAILYLIEYLEEVSERFIKILKKIYKNNHKYIKYMLNDYIIEDINQLNNNASYEELKKYIVNIGEFLDNFLNYFNFYYYGSLVNMKTKLKNKL